MRTGSLQNLMQGTGTRLIADTADFESKLCLRDLDAWDSLNPEFYRDCSVQCDRGNDQS